MHKGKTKLKKKKIEHCQPNIIPCDCTNFECSIGFWKTKGHIKFTVFDDVAVVFAPYQISILPVCAKNMSHILSPIHAKSEGKKQKCECET